MFTRARPRIGEGARRRLRQSPRSLPLIPGLARKEGCDAVLVYAVVVDDDPRAVELFVRPEDAEAFVEDVRADDEELAGTLRLEPVDLEA